MSEVKGFEPSAGLGDAEKSASQALDKMSIFDKKGKLIARVPVAPDEDIKAYKKDMAAIAQRGLRSKKGVKESQVSVGVDDSPDDGVNCEVCNDAPGGCSQCGFGRNQKNTK